MRSVVLISLLATSFISSAQTQPAVTTSASERLPVRRVVLYKKWHRILRARWRGARQSGDQY